MKTLYLIRHGETELNAKRIVQPAATPLSERGLAQARSLARRLSAHGVGRILSSDLARALMTAEQVQARTAAPIELEPLLQERNFGDIRGTPYAELDFDLFAPEYHPPGGESWEQFEERMAQAWTRVDRIARATEGGLAVVTHGLVCRSLASRHMVLDGGGDPAATAPLRWGNTSLTIAEGPDPWRIRLLNCTAHLEGNTADDAEAPSGM